MAELTKLDPRRFAITFTQPSKTKQSERDACNINSIVAKYNRTGEQPQNMRSVTPQYGDFSAVENLHAALNLVNDSMRSFAELPSHIRDHCNNDPAQLLELASDPERREEAIDLGIIDATPADLEAIADQAATPGVDPPPETGETPPETPPETA